MNKEPAYIFVISVLIVIMFSLSFAYYDGATDNHDEIQRVVDLCNAQLIELGCIQNTTEPINVTLWSIT